MLTFSPKLSCLICVSSVLMFSTSSLLSLSSQPSIAVNQKMMTSNILKVKVINVLAREELRPPLGIPVKPNRDIGFASVFMRIENPQEKNTTLKIQNIQIRNISDGKQQTFSMSPQEILLRPLENSENAFHLTNKVGFVGHDKIKAIVTYQIGQKIFVAESQPFDVNRL